MVSTVQEVSSSKSVDIRWRHRAVCNATLRGFDLDKWLREHGADVTIWPVDFGAVFAVSGGLPLPKRSPQRHAYRMMELKRWRDRVGVPLTLQPMVVLLGGLALGGRLGLASQVLYLAAGIVGLPVFAASITLPPGALRLLGPTGGYIVGFIVASFVVGSIAQRGATRHAGTTVAAYAAGTAVVYALGVSWLAVYADMSLVDALRAGMVPFLIGDLIKAVAAGAVLPAAWRLTGR